ncbi:MAG: FmdE family protein [Thermoflexales bacterium]
MKTLEELLKTTETLHRHLCPRQVLGVRMGMAAAASLNLDLPQTDKRLVAFVESDGCFSDGLAVATGCWVGRRTMRVEDLGKVAAVFVDTRTNRTLRIHPRLDVRARAAAFAPEARNRWEAQLLGYQRMPADLLFDVRPVRLTRPIEEIMSRPGLRVTCAVCGEEIINGREVPGAGGPVCRTCMGDAYYSETARTASVEPWRALFENAA